MLLPGAHRGRTGAGQNTAQTRAGKIGYFLKRPAAKRDVNSPAQGGAAPRSIGCPAEQEKYCLILMEKSAIIMLLYIHRCAGVSEWQTMWTQNPLVVIPCGFDPHHRHKNPQPQGWGFFAGGGGRTERRWKHRKQSPSGALFSSRVSPYRKQYRGRSRGRFKIFPSHKAGGFCRWRGSNRAAVSSTAPALRR